MSPRGSLSASASTSGNPRSASMPYTRRPAGQPKSSRQQFSACGACRMRRVRCDLKDLPFSTVGPHPACSNCKERGLKCVDEFADVKAVKLLRRGRRLQQVEAIYGKSVASDGASSSLSSPPATRLPSIIPQLTPEFFASPFWSWFLVQRPVLDPIEFPARFAAHNKGIQSLGHEGGLIAMILVVWAASFGLDERGVPEVDDHGLSDLLPPSHGVGTSGSIEQDAIQKDPSLERRAKERKDRTESMLREVLELIDFHGVMRRPTWDGVRVLLLIMPLLEEAQPLERQAIYEATMSQAQALCTLASGGTPSSINPYPGADDDGVIRARIFWYAHMYEGVSTGLHGGRLVLNSDDFETFQNTISQLDPMVNNLAIPSPPASDSQGALSSHGIGQAQQAHSQSPSQSFFHVSHIFSLPLQLNAVCRKVHSVLTGPKAIRRAEEHGLIDANGMREVWEDLDHCWNEFEAMRRSTNNELDIRNREQFVSAWQIVIFECHNIIRESLKQCMSRAGNSSQAIFSTSPPSRPSSHSSSSPYLSPHHLHAIATRKCFSLLPIILRIIKFHLTQRGRSLFKWDAGLVRDGCWFAGFLAASVEGDTIDFLTDERDDELSRRSRFSVDEGISICLAALGEMQWAFSRSEEREETVRMIWGNKKAGRNTGRAPAALPNRSDVNRLGPGMYPDPQLPSYGKPGPMTGHPAPHTYSSVSVLNNRPLLPPLSLARSPRRAESAPSTAYSTSGHGANGWPSYTPPGTATSVATSNGTGVSLSARGSPVFAALAAPMAYKADPHESFYHLPQDLDQFSFNVPMVGPGVSDASAMSVAAYQQRDPPQNANLMPRVTSSAYVDASVFAASSSSMVNGDGHGSCPQFGEDCNGYYH